MKTHKSYLFGMFTYTRCNDISITTFLGKLIYRKVGCVRNLFGITYTVNYHALQNK